MAITINQITSGMGLSINGDIYLINEYHHVKPGKGSAFVRVKLRNIITDAVLEKTFKTSDKLDNVNLEENELEFLYHSGESYHFMDHTTYEQVAIDKSNLGSTSNFLLENLTVTGLCYNNKILKIILPNFVIAQIAQTEPGIRGDSTKAGTKPAKIETGATVQVPLFVNIGDKIRLDTRSGQYVERVQK